MAHSHAGHHHGPGDHGALHSRAAHGDSSDPGHVRKLRLALAVTLVVLVAEVIGGIASNSLALLADAGHMLTDVAALALSLFVSWFSMRPETPRRTYGYVRLEILAAADTERRIAEATREAGEEEPREPCPAGAPWPDGPP